MSLWDKVLTGPHSRLRRKAKCRRDNQIFKIRNRAVERILSRIKEAHKELGRGNLRLRMWGLRRSMKPHMEWVRLSRLRLERRSKSRLMLRWMKVALWELREIRWMKTEGMSKVWKEISRIWGKIKSNHLSKKRQRHKASLIVQRTQPLHNLKNNSNPNLPLHLIQTSQTSFQTNPQRTLAPSPERLQAASLKPKSNPSNPRKASARTTQAPRVRVTTPQAQQSSDWGRPKQGRPTTNPKSGPQALRIWTWAHWVNHRLVRTRTSALVSRSSRWEWTNRLGKDSHQKTATKMSSPSRRLKAKVKRRSQGLAQVL